MPLTVAIIGRPNVGKSTLFNRLVGKKLALVDDTPGVTRDRREGDATLGDLSFQIFDTAGLEMANDESLEARMREQTDIAIELADACMMMIDARNGISPHDEYFANLIRKSDKPILLIANKCEGSASDAGLYESFKLGLGEPIALSAEHGEGMGDLYAALEPLVADYEAAHADEEIDEPENDQEDFDPDAEVVLDLSKPLRIAIVGRPNVGKSTLVNRFLGEERMLTGPEAGITRDSIGVEWEWQDRKIKLFDTAGMRRKSRVSEKLEKLSVADSLRAIRFAEVVVLLIDGTMPLEKQDLQIADLIIEEGRALVLAINKWDKVENREEALRTIRHKIEIALPHVRGIPFVTLSALTGRGTDRIMPTVAKVYEVWNERVGTSKLNRWLEEALMRHPPPALRGRRLKVRYMTQVKTRPPTFALFSSRAKEIPTSYIRYLINSMRETFDLPAVPIRMNMRQSENPYAGKAKRKH